MTLDWKTPFTETRLVAMRRIWQSRCGRYRVVRSKSLYEKDSTGEPAVHWFAMRYNGHCWDIISRHQAKPTAVEACERDAARLAREEALAKPKAKKPKAQL